MNKTLENSEKPKNLRSMDQERAKRAWDCIQEVKNNDTEVKKKYRSYVKNAPALIQINGLGNALAFYRSKIGKEETGESKLSPEKKAYSILYNHINGWIKGKRKEINDTLEWIIGQNTSSMDVFSVTVEIMSFLGWLERFAEAELPEENDKIEKNNP